MQYLQLCLKFTGKKIIHYERDTKPFYFADASPAFDIPSVMLGDLGILGFGLAGLLVGFGTKLGNGCTSGHGVCGLPRLSIRSYAAVGCFMGTGIATATAKYYSKNYDN